MIKVALLCLLMVAAASIGVGVYTDSAARISPDIPPPTCAPNCPLNR